MTRRKVRGKGRKMKKRNTKKSFPAKKLLYMDLVLIIAGSVLVCNNAEPESKTTSSCTRHKSLLVGQKKSDHKL